MGTKERSARRSFLQRSVDFAIGGGAAILGFVLLAATTVHLIASVDLAPVVPPFVAAPRVAAPVKIAAAPPRAARTHDVSKRMARSQQATRPRIVWAPSLPQRKLRVVSPPAVVARRLPGRPHADPPRPVRVALRGDAIVSTPVPQRFVAQSRPRRRSGQSSAAPRRASSTRLSMVPPLIGVSGDLVAPRLDGIRMRGRIIVPTPAPTASAVPPSRTGLSPGP